MEERADDFSELSLSALLRIDKACDAYETAKRQGRETDLNLYLGSSEGKERESLIKHLAAIDADYGGISLAELSHRLIAEGFHDCDLSFAEATNSHQVVRELVDRGQLTPFQASQLIAPQPHPLLLDDYQLIERIGAGGMGTVFRALHRRMKRIVAVKIVAHGMAADVERRRLFQSEIESAARLNHPQVVTAYDAGESRGLVYLVSEFVAGMDLDRWVRDYGPLSIEQALVALEYAAAGLAHIHSHGLVHRDVKPSNLMRDDNGRVRVLDVGLARLSQSATGRSHLGSRSIVGTVAYMAPEQALQPEAVDARADIFALGATLYFLLTGKHPHVGKSITQRFANRSVTAAPPLRSERNEVPKWLDRLYGRMVDVDRGHRPATMQQVIDEIQGSRQSYSRPLILSLYSSVIIATLLLVVWLTHQVNLNQLPPLVPFDGAMVQKQAAQDYGLPVELTPLPGWKTRLIPPGRFVRGTPADSIREWAAGRPSAEIQAWIHNEQIRTEQIDYPFYLSTTEVTIGQFREFVNSTTPPYRTKAEREDGLGFKLDAGGVWRLVRGAHWRSAGEQPTTDDYPVFNLTRDDCSDFCRWLARRLEGRMDCRLPTEIEWEYACRAGTDTHWSTGNTLTDLSLVAWYSQTVDSRDSRLQPTALKVANPFGLFDMHGNIMEWCIASPPFSGAVLRGGNIRSSAFEVRSAARMPLEPNIPQGGFRVVFVPKNRLR